MRYLTTRTSFDGYRVIVYHTNGTYRTYKNPSDASKQRIRYILARYEFRVMSYITYHDYEVKIA